jgi:hypothetical protein
MLERILTMIQEIHLKFSKQLKRCLLWGSLSANTKNLTNIKKIPSKFTKRWFRLELIAKVLFDKLNKLLHLKNLKRTEQVIKSISQFKMVTRMTQKIPTNRSLISLMHKILLFWSMKLLRVLGWTS